MNRQKEKTPFWILSSWDLRPKKRRENPRDHERSVGGRANTDSIFADITNPDWKKPSAFSKLCLSKEVSFLPPTRVS
jgi:hypothetical protein